MLSLLIFALFQFINADYCGDWNPIPLEDVHLAAPNDTIEVYYMAAPLMYCTYLDDLGYLNGFHGGVGLKNLRTGYTFTINFDGYPTFGSTFFPIITRLPNGTFNLQWQNFGRVFLYDGINDTYWHSLKPNRFHVIDMNGDQFNQFRNFIAAGNASFPFYNPWFLYSSFPSSPVGPAGFECFQYCFRAIQEIIKLGGKLVPGVNSLPVSLGIAYTKQSITKVDFYAPEWHDRIVDFFLLIERQWNELGLIGFLEEFLLIIATGEFFFRHNADYYHAKLNFPFFEMHWTQFPLDSWNSSWTNVPELLSTKKLPAFDSFFKQ